MKSRGMNPNAPINAIRSPKKGNIAANIVAITTDNDRDINLGITLRIENCLLFGSANCFSNASLVGCK